MTSLDATDEGDMLSLGKISGVFGVKGWVKIFSHTSPRQQIVKYSPLYLRKNGKWQAVKVVKGHKQGKAVVAQLEGVDDRDQAFALIGTEIAIKQNQLPTLSNDSFYWADLEGVSVFTLEDIKLGKIEWVFDTGSNNVIVVKGELDGKKKDHMVPWIMDDVIKSVDLEASRIVVDWDPEF